MAFVHGKGAYFAIGATANNLSPYLESIEWDQSVDMAEASVMGNEQKIYISGLSDFTISIAGRYDSTITTGPDAVLSALVGQDTISAFWLGPEGSAAGKVKYTGNAFLTGYKITAPISGVVGFTADFQASATVSRGVF